MRKIFLWLKRRLIPTSLMARVQVLLILPIVLIIGLSALLFFIRHWHEVQTAMVRSAVREVVFVLDNRHLPAAELQDLAQYFGMRITLLPNLQLPTERLISDRSSDRLMTEFMQQFGLSTFDIDSSREDKVIDIWVAQPEGLYHLNFHQSRIASFTIRLMVGFVLLFALTFSAIAAVFMRKQMQPIVDLTRLMVDQQQSFDPTEHQKLRQFGFSGATEVRDLTRAFFHLQKRQYANLTERSEMLRGISHDLRTPLTRMSLSLQMQPDTEDNRALQADIQLMTRMVDSYLQFSAENSREQPSLVSIESIVRGVKSRWAGYLGEGEATTGSDSEANPVDVSSVYSGAENAESRRLHVAVIAANLQAQVFIRPTMLSRAIDNVIDNGFRFAGGVWLNIRAQGQTLVLTIGDDGPGVPAQHRERILEPFQRLDANRMAVGGGSGLGLAMVKETLLIHGGEINLDTACQGGLQVRLMLPLSEE